MHLRDVVGGAGKVSFGIGVLKKRRCTGTGDAEARITVAIKLSKALVVIHHVTKFDKVRQVGPRGRLVGWFVRCPRNSGKCVDVEEQHSHLPYGPSGVPE